MKNDCILEAGAWSTPPRPHPSCRDAATLLGRGGSYSWRDAATFLFGGGSGAHVFVCCRCFSVRRVYSVEERVIVLSFILHWLSTSCSVYFVVLPAYLRLSFQLFPPGRPALGLGGGRSNKPICLRFVLETNNL